MVITVCAALCSFTDPVEAIASASPGDRIELGDGVWSFSATIDRDLTIAAMNPGLATIQPEGGLPAFDLAQPVVFALEDLAFGPGEGGIVHAWYGADVSLSRVTSADLDPVDHLILQVGGAVTIVDSSFTGTMTTLPYEVGTVIATHAATVTLDRVTIDFSGPTGAVRGGAIHGSDTTLTLIDTVISNASVDGDGGAVFADYGTNLEVIGGSFTDNMAGGAGGHVFVAGAGTATFTGVDFVRGTSIGPYWGAGAVFGATRVDDCDFVSNSALQGGAIVAVGGGLDVVNSRFDGNTATLNGGAVYTNSIDWLTIEDSVFTSNHAFGSDGGAVDNAWGGDVTVVGSWFEANSAGQFGGGLANAGPSWSQVESTTFLANGALEGAGASFFYGTGYGLDIADSAFVGNVAVDSGGGLLIHSNGVANVARTLICDNASGWAGGGIAVYATWSEFNSLHLKNAAVLDNTAVMSGGGVAVHGGVSDFLILNSDLLGNQSGEAGSGAYASEVGMVEVVNSLVAWSGGGAAGLWVDLSVLYSPWIAHNAWWTNDPADAAGEIDAGFDAVTTDPMLTSYVGGGDCFTQDLTPLPGSPLIDAGDPYLSDHDGTVSDIGVTGGPYAPLPGTGTGTGTGAATGTGTGTGTGAGTGTGTGTGSVDADQDGYAAPDDCDDGDARVHPGRPELADDGVDNDCDGWKARSWLSGSSCDHGRGAPGAAWLGLLAVAVRRQRARNRAHNAR